MGELMVADYNRKDFVDVIIKAYPEDDRLL